MTEKVKVRIDGEVIAANAGQTILEVARANNTYIPALCYMEGLSAVGACRLCMVEISGVGRLQPACTTPVQEGLAVVTDSPTAPGLPQDRPRAPVLRAQPRLRRVRLLRPLRAADPGPGPRRDAHPLPVQLPAARGRHLAPALRARSQPLHPLLALRPRVRRDRGRPRVGHGRPRHPVAARLRAEAAVGRGDELHELRQVRHGLPDRRDGREGLGSRGDDEDRRPSSAASPPCGRAN